MLFNSFQFAIFFIIVYGLYISFNHKWQNRMLLLASYVFYGAWDWRFLSLIVISTVLDYYCGIFIHESGSEKRRKYFLTLSIVGNLFILGFFKYYDFFAVSLKDLFLVFGVPIDPRLLNIVLPVGISFYTFQTMSYTMDIYRNEMEPTKKFLDFALFVSFFPQLVAGPIERAKHLLPQVLNDRKLSLEKFYEGCYLISWGLFQKVFVADNLSRIVDPVFASGPPYNGAKVLLALYAFAFQIFCDFAGYSNIARGLGKCMGFDIMINFNLPYFSTNPKEFWRRWHISLSSWLRDYLYIPLGGNKRGTVIMYRNLAITMLLGGLWHGAAWTFVLWGAYQGFLLILHRLSKPFLSRIVVKGRIAGRIWFFIRVFMFFHLVCLGWLFFRAQSMLQIADMIKAVIFNFDLHNWQNLTLILINLILCIWFLLLMQLFQFIKNDLFYCFKLHWAVQGMIYFLIFYITLTYGVNNANEFIYFQF